MVPLAVSKTLKDVHKIPVRGMQTWEKLHCLSEQRTTRLTCSTYPPGNALWYSFL